jgi:hypothetical protein
VSPVQEKALHVEPSNEHSFFAQPLWHKKGYRFTAISLWSVSRMRFFAFHRLRGLGGTPLISGRKEGQMVNRTAIKILKYKAESLKTSPEYAAYVETVLRDLEIKDAKEAFMLGAVDAMMNGATASMNGTGVLKKALLKEIAKSVSR